MPPHNNPRLPSYWDRATPDDLPPTQFWIESSLENKGVAPQHRSTDGAGNPTDHPQQNGRSSQHLPIRKQPASPKNGKKQELRFFNVSDPKELKDRSQLRLNRQHVMHTFLDKERQKPSGQRDARVDGAGAAIKRKRSRIQIPTRFAAESKQDENNGRRSLPTPDASDRQAERRASTSTQESGELKRTRQMACTYGQHSNQQLIKGINGSWDNSRYIMAAFEDIPFHTTEGLANHPGSTVGAHLNPFDTWPAFSDEGIDVNQLKYNCSRRFGSEGISIYWVPELLRARHAFLSTICISAAHDDIMSRAHRSIPARNFLSTREGVQRLRVRSEVISMVNQSLEDPELRTADATIISVLHLLNSEIMGCNDRVMKTHQDGLHRMVRQRGGLEGLGVHGQLARILTITMYMISVLRESPPHSEFATYASRHAAPIPTDARALPESPVYCRASGYQTITPETCHSLEIWDLLNTLRDVTKYISPQQAPNGTGTAKRSASASLLELRERVFTLPPAHSSELSFPDLSTRYIYETLRLTALLYTHALHTKTPFSIASTDITSGTATTSAGVWPPGLSATQSLQIQIRKALLRTDCSSCWGPLAGVLFWVALVSGAGGNPGPLAEEDREGEEEDARKFLAAVAVRCSIVLSFEHGEAVLEGLRRLVGVEGVLNAGNVGIGQDEAAGEGEAGGFGICGGSEDASQSWMQGLWTSEPGMGTWIDGQEMEGPEMPSDSVWNERGWAQMGDFARDFEGLG